MLLNGRDQNRKRRRRRRRADLRSGDNCWPAGGYGGATLEMESRERTEFERVAEQPQVDLRDETGRTRRARRQGQEAPTSDEMSPSSNRRPKKFTYFYNYCFSSLLLALVCALGNRPVSSLQSPAGQNGNFDGSTMSSPTLGQPEGRAEHMMRNSPASTLEMLNNLLNSYQNRNPLNGQRNPLPQVSTPVIPFLQNPSANNQQQPPQLSPFQQPGRRIQLPQNNPNFNRPQSYPNQNQNPSPIVFPNLPLGVSSSPPTPYLTLNRLSNQLGANTGNQFANNNNNINPNINTRNPNPQPPFGARQPLMPPRGAQPNQQPARAPVQLAPPPRLPPSIPLPPSANVQPPQANQVKPVTGGFAPSGPPPSPLGNPNAMTVVQSPPPVATTTGASLDEAATEIKQTLATTTTSSRPAASEPATTFSAPVTTTSTTATAATTEAERVTTAATTGGGAESSSSWSPVESQQQPQQSRPKVTLAPSPDIVTVPPGYNPDAPSNKEPETYDISVSAKMGESANSSPKISIAAPESTPTAESSSTTAQPSSETVATTSTHRNTETTATPTLAPSPTIATVAPTAVTTIIWSPPVPTSEPTLLYAPVQPTRVLDLAPTPTATLPSSSPRPSPNPQPSQAPSTPPSRVRDNSLLAEDPEQLAKGVVYGKPQTRDSKPTAPPASGEQPQGRPFIKPAPIDAQVRPFSAGPSPNSVFRSNQHSPFKASKPLGANQSPVSVGSGFTITASGNQTMPTGDIQDYVADHPPPLFASPASGGHASGSFQVSGDAQEPTISAQGGQDPASFDLSAQDSQAKEQQVVGGASPATTNSSSAQPPAAPKVRRPTFKPKPAEPPIRIDSCIVGDENSCDQSHNERCVTEYGISSCHCKPGFARLSQLRGYCSPVSLLQLTLRIERLSDERRLSFNQTLENPNTEEYQYMEFETVQALAGAFQQTQLAKQFMGARVNRFFEQRGRVWANVSVNLEANNVTRSAKISQLVGQELAKVVAGARSAPPVRPLGESTIMLDATKESVSRLVDVNECAAPELNDCSKQAACTNDFGGFQCQCLPGYEDRHASKDRSRQGRVCLGCSAAYCSNRGECSIVDGQKQCKCRANFMGARCDIDSEVMAVAIGGSLVGVIILVVTYWCLFVFQRRWKREQQKMDAMSATSGLTYNYVNSSSNSLMSPTRIIGGIQRAGGHQVASSYAQRFGVVGGHHYAPDQQAIIGSTSSGSSASSQPIACNPYAGAMNAAYQYEDSNGLLVAPDSAGSSEQSSPSGQSYRGVHLPGTAYTLSGHHHHHNHSHHLVGGGLSHGKSQLQLSQFHPAAAAGMVAADYRTMGAPMPHCPAGNMYDNRWHRTLQQDAAKQHTVGYYLSPDMLVNHHHQQQLYASPQRELCIDTELVAGRSRRQQGRSGAGPSAQTLRSRSQGPRPSQRNPSIYGGAIDHEHERPI